MRLTLLALVPVVTFAACTGGPSAGDAAIDAASVDRTAVDAFVDALAPSDAIAVTDAIDAVQPDVPGDVRTDAPDDVAAGPCIPPGGATVEYAVRAQPRVTLPAAGGTFVDPTFGTTLIRVTDATSGTEAHHAYGYWPVFNADSTRFHISVDGQATLYQFDPTSSAVTRLAPLFAGAPCAWEDAFWSHTDPNILYCHSVTPRRLYAYDIRRPGMAGLTLIHDFEADLGAGADINMLQMLLDERDDAFTFHTRNDTGTRYRAVVYVRSTNRTYVRDYRTRGLDETHMDLAGRYAVVQLDNEWDVWDFRADTSVAVHRNDTERGGLCHQAGARGLYVGGDCWQTGFLVRPFDDPLRWRHLVSFYRADGTTLNWDYDIHLTVSQRDQRYFVSSLYTPALNPAVWNPWEQEIVAVAMDGSWVARLAHHHSDVRTGGYWASPRASISYDGRFVVFTSNWDGARRDVFILRMPVLCR